MPKKYIVETDKGKFVVEVDDGAGSPSDAKPIDPNETDNPLLAGARTFGKYLKDEFSGAMKRTAPTKDDPFSVHVASPGIEKFMQTPLARPTGVDAVDGLLSPFSLSTLGMSAAKPLLEAPLNRGTAIKGLRAVGDFDMTKPFKGAAGKAADLLEGSRRPEPNIVETAQDALVRRGGESTGGAAQTDRIPYASPTSRPQTSGFGRVFGKAPTLDAALQSALEESMGKVDPAKSSTSADQVSVGGMQKPKTPAVKGKSPAPGAPGGYTTDNPPKPAYGAPEPASAPDSLKSTRFSEADAGGDDLGRLLDDIHGTTEEDAAPHINPEGVGTESRSFVDTMKSTEPEFNRDVHTGAERKSPLADSARVHHQAFGEMDADYRRRISDPLGALLMALIGGEAAGKQPDDQRE